MTEVIDREQFRKIIAEQLQVDLEKVVDTARFTDDLEADSLDLVELIMAFEETWVQPVVATPPLKWRWHDAGSTWVPAAG